MVGLLLSALLYGDASAATAIPHGRWADSFVQTSPEIITELRVQGNQIATDAQVIALSGVTIGSPFTAATIDDVTKRLRDSKQFDDVQVLKRFASIVDPTKIVIVIIVNEGPVKLVVPKTAGQPIRVVKRGGLSRLMWLPIVSGEDGYGITFGAQIAVVDVTGRRGRVSFPLTWGGTKQAGAEFERTFVAGPFTRIQFGTSISRQKNPGFQIDDDRRGVWGRLERRAGPLLAGVRVGSQHISFDTDSDEVRSVRGDIAFDTRADPVYPRNAVYAIASLEHLSFAGQPSEPGIASSINRTHLEARGFIGLIGQTVLAMRVLREDADTPMPRYFESLLGGWSTLRGFAAGAFPGDTMVAGSLEFRVPLSSALSIGKIGMSVFADSGEAYQKGQRFRDATLHSGIGASVWLSAAFFQVGLGVSHGSGAGMRVNFGTGVSF